MPTGMTFISALRTSYIVPCTFFGVCHIGVGFIVVYLTGGVSAKTLVRR